MFSYAYVLSYTSIPKYISHDRLSIRISVDISLPPQAGATRTLSCARRSVSVVPITSSMAFSTIRGKISLNLSAATDCL